MLVCRLITGVITGGCRRVAWESGVDVKGGEEERGTRFRRGIEEEEAAFRNEGEQLRAREAETEEDSGGPRLPCESAAEKNPLSTSRNPKTVPREDFRLNDRWLMFVEDETSCTRFPTPTTVALATARGYNGPLCFSRSIGMPGERAGTTGGHQPPRSLGRNPLLSGQDL